MSNNIAIRITADVADLIAKKAVMSAELKAATKDLNDLAKAAKSGGVTDDLKTSMLAAADAVSKARAQIKGVDAELKRVGEGAANAGKGTEVASHHVMNFGYQINDMVVGLASGQRPLTVFLQQGAQIGQIAAQSGVGVMGLAKATWEQARATPVVSALLSPMGLAIGAVGTVAVSAAIAAKQLSDEQQRLTVTSLGLGAASGLSAEQIRAAGEAAARSGEQSVTAAIAGAEAFARAGVQSSSTITGLSEDVGLYAKLTGQDAADAQNELATAMKEPVKGAETLNDRLQILDATQLEQIRTLAASGEQAKAVAILEDALRKRLDEARAAGVQAASTWGQMTDSLSNLWRWLRDVNGRLDDFNLKWGMYLSGQGGKFEAAVAGAKAQRDAAAQQIARAQLNSDSSAGAALVAGTPEGQDAARRTALTSGISTLNKALAAEKQLHGENSDAYRRTSAALGEYKRALDSFIPSAEKAHQLSALDARLAEARQKHDKAGVQSLTEQRARLAMAGEVMSSADVDRAAADAGVKAYSGTAPAKGKKGPSAVSEWAQELQAQQIAEQNFFGESTEAELKFWQSKLALTKAGSKDRLDVQARIYQAEKTLARGAYDDRLAELDEQIQADRDNWAKVRADWDEKLAFIASKHGQESAEYRRAHREFLAEERRHEAEIERARQQAQERALDGLRRHLDTLRSIREQDAATQEALIRDRAQGQPLGEIEAVKAIAEQHHQLIEQQLTDLETLHAAQRQILSDEAAAADPGSGAYIEARAAMARADAEYFDQRATLEAQARNQAIQDILSLKQAYAGYMSGVVSATTSGFLGAVTRTQTFGQAAMGVYRALLGTVDQVLQQMVLRWITTHLLMSATQKAELAVQTGAHVAAESVKTGATIAGTATQTAVTVGGEAAKVAAVAAGQAAQVAATATGTATKAGIVGASNLKEITSHAAVAAAAAYRAMAGIPVVGPVLGAIAAATTFVAVEAFGALASLDVGTNFVPSDQLARIHQGERVMPAADNRAVIDLLRVGANARQVLPAIPRSEIAPSLRGEFGSMRSLPQHAIVEAIRGGPHAEPGAARGDFHLHYAPALERQNQPLRDQLWSHAGTLADILRQLRRDGKL